MRSVKMSVVASNTKLCKLGVCAVLLMLPFVSFVQGYNHNSRILLINATTILKSENSSATSIDATTTIKTNETISPNETRPIQETNVSLSTEPPSNGTTVVVPTIEDIVGYSSYNKTCYQCLYEHQLEAAIYKILNNDSYNASKPNDTCSHCLTKKFSNKTQSVGCMCGIYTTQTPTTLDLPLRTKVFQNISCHELVPFEDACKKVCILGTLAFNELEPSTLCYHMTSASNVKAYVESKICRDDTHWDFTGLASSTPVCCDRGVPVNC